MCLVKCFYCWVAKRFKIGLQFMCTGSLTLSKAKRKVKPKCVFIIRIQTHEQEWEPQHLHQGSLHHNISKCLYQMCTFYWHLQKLGTNFFYHLCYFRLEYNHNTPFWGIRYISKEICTQSMLKFKMK